jgi:RNA polymerase sigma-70 factor (ECF subfamily)
MTDAELGDLYARYAHVLHHRCRAILRNDEDARDAVHETFARVLRNHEAFRAEASPLTWMIRISTNHCLNVLRDRGLRAGKLDRHGPEILGYDATVPQPDGVLLDWRTIAPLLEDADDQTRATVLYTFVDGCSREQTARLVGLSVPTVRKRVRTFVERARKALGLTAPSLEEVG